LEDARGTKAASGNYSEEDPFAKLAIRHQGFSQAEQDLRDASSGTDLAALFNCEYFHFDTCGPQLCVEIFDH